MSTTRGCAGIRIGCAGGRGDWARCGSGWAGFLGGWARCRGVWASRPFLEPPHERGPPAVVDTRFRDIQVVRVGKNESSERCAQSSSIEERERAAAGFEAGRGCDQSEDQRAARSEQDQDPNWPPDPLQRFARPVARKQADEESNYSRRREAIEKMVTEEPRELGLLHEGGRRIEAVGHDGGEHRLVVRGRTILALGQMKATGDRRPECEQEVARQAQAKCQQ